MIDRRGAATGLFLGALVVILGSLATWGTCPNTSCRTGTGFGFDVLVDWSGLDFGWGLATLGLGLVLGAISVYTLRGGSSALTLPIVRGCVVATLAVVGVSLATTSWELFGRPFEFYGPKGGQLLVSIGAVIGLIASTRLRMAASAGN
jgi:hypothetical protein